MDCDDKLSTYGGTYEGGARDICCATCWGYWYDTTDTSLNVTVCGLENDSATMLEKCVDQNKGTFTTVTTITQDTATTEQEMEDAIVSLFDGEGIGWDDIQDSLSGNDHTLTIYYPWDSESDDGYAYMAGDDFETDLEAELSDNNYSVGDTTLSNTVGNGDNELYTQSVSYPVMYFTADSRFGASSDAAENRKTWAGRTTMYMGLPLEGYKDKFTETTDQKDKLGEYCYEAFQDHFDDGPGGGMDVYWDCEYMDGYFTQAKLTGDMLLLGGTIVFIYCYMAYTTDSWFLASNGMYMIFMNFIPSLFLYSFILQN
eukprot:UN25075